MKSEREKLQSLILKVEEKKKSKSFYKEDYEEVEQFYEEITGRKPEPLSGRNPPIIRALKALELLKEIKNILEEKQEEEASEESDQPEPEQPEEETPEELTDEDKKLNKNIIEHKEIIEQKIETAKLDSDINFDNIKKLIDNKNTNDGIIWVNSRVEDKRPIIEAVNEVRRRYGETGMITSNPGDLDDEPYVEYYLNTFRDLSDIKRYFNEYIYRNPNEQKPFKVCLTFGLIELDIKNLGTEIKKEDVEIILPHVNQRNNFEPCIVRNKATKKLFYEYIDKLIDQFIHDQASTNSGHVIIGLFSESSSFKEKHFSFLRIKKMMREKNSLKNLINFLIEIRKRTQKKKKKGKSRRGVRGFSLGGILVLITFPYFPVALDLFRDFSRELQM